MVDAPTLTRSWPALGAVGAALIQLALGAGPLTAADAGPVLRTAAFLLVAIGGAGMLWGVVSLARGRPVVPRLGMVGSLAGMVGCGWALTTDPARVSVLAAAAAWVLLAVVGGFCAIQLRADRGSARDADAGGRTGVVGILVASAAVAALVSPALAATDIGRLAPDHSEHSVTVTHSH